MLSFEITCTDKTVYRLENVLSVILNSDLNVPADDLEVVCVYDERLMNNADRITAYSKGKMVFTGQIDEVFSYKTDSGILNRITARSPASLLLDNEALPLSYTNPNARFIYEKHLEPFGISCSGLDEKPFFGVLKVDKGMTHWSVFRNFCINRYGVEPRITADGKAYFDARVQSPKEEFINDGTRCDYYSRRDSLKRCKLISAVKLKLYQTHSYDGVIRNNNPDCKGITRERLINAVAEKTNLKTADDIIKRSNLNSREIRLECFGERLVFPGTDAKIIDEEWGVEDNLTVKRIKYYFASNREKTTVILGKERG